MKWDCVVDVAGRIKGRYGSAAGGDSGVDDQCRRLVAGARTARPDDARSQRGGGVPVPATTRVSSEPVCVCS